MIAITPTIAPAGTTAPPPTDAGLDLAALYEQHWPAVSRFLRRRMPGAPAAEVEDVAAFVWERICRYAPRYREQGRLGPWIYRIARTALADRHRRARPTVELTEAGSPTTADAGGELQCALLDVVAAWQRLPHAQRVVLVERFVYGHSHAEAALVLGISAMAARHLQHRALATLRRLLDGPQGQNGERP